MADFIDLLTSSDYNLKGNLASQLTEKLKKTNSAKELLDWFHSIKDPIKGKPFNRISLDDCERIIKNKENLLKYGDLLTAKNVY